jgi:ribonuclease P protein component
VVYCRRNRLGANRLGYTVSTKLGHAVVRNRVRRRLREVVRLNSSALTQGWDIILVARGRAVGAPFDKLTRAYLDCCGKLGLIREAAP